MKKGKKTVIIVVASILFVATVVVGIVLGISYKNKRLLDEYMSKNIELYSELNIAANSQEVDGNRYSLASVKESVRIGVNTVSLDLCFNESGVPVISADFDSINENSLLLEDVLKLLSDEKYKSVRLMLNLKQLGSLSDFNKLLSDYDMGSRVIVCGINENKYSLISGNSTAAKVFFDFVPTGNEQESVDKITEMISEYNISGVIIDSEKITQSLADLLNEKGILFIADNTNEKLKMAEILSYGVSFIKTENPQELKDLYTQWKNATQQRMEQSIIDKINNGA